MRLCLAVIILKHINTHNIIEKVVYVVNSKYFTQHSMGSFLRHTIKNVTVSCMLITGRNTDVKINRNKFRNQLIYRWLQI